MRTPSSTGDRAALEACIDACVAAHAALRRHDPGAGAPPAARAESALARLMRDCAEVCEATALYLRSGSVFYDRMCIACAELCEQCAASCVEAGGPDQVVQACRTCAQCCRDLVGGDARA